MHGNKTAQPSPNGNVTDPQTTPLPTFSTSLITGDIHIQEVSDMEGRSGI